MHVALKTAGQFEISVNYKIVGAAGSCREKNFSSCFQLYGIGFRASGGGFCVCGRVLPLG